MHLVCMWCACLLFKCFGFDFLRKKEEEVRKRGRVEGLIRVLGHALISGVYTDGENRRT